MQPELNFEQIHRAANAVRNATALLFTAGAGMGVDSGLPDFRGNEGFWKAYPPIARLGLSFQQMANPQWFEKDPALAWGFYGHRLNLYRKTAPHEGFNILRQWGRTRPYGVYTSNVDGHFQRSGFENVCEVHGSVLHLQCSRPCSREIWDAGDLEIQVDETSFRAVGELPRCPRCNAVARPNILMFSDSQWVETRSLAQEQSLIRWLGALDLKRLSILEMGAGTTVPTVRYFSEYLQARGATLIRINPREAHGPLGTVGIESGARAALSEIAALINS